MMRCRSRKMKTVHIQSVFTSPMCHTLVSLLNLQSNWLTLVKPNTALDRDARKRATSVYLVQRAVPMLPPQLSEELCSLRPNEDRLAFTASFTIDGDGNVLKNDFTRTIIK